MGGTHLSKNSAMADIYSHVSNLGRFWVTGNFKTGLNLELFPVDLDDTPKLSFFDILSLINALFYEIEIIVDL
jgi:hypothetical protein